MDGGGASGMMGWTGGEFCSISLGGGAFCTVF